MPTVNGVEAVKRIRRINESLPIIMLTVFDDNENISKPSAPAPRVIF